MIFFWSRLMFLMENKRLATNLTSYKNIKNTENPVIYKCNITVNVHEWQSFSLLSQPKSHSHGNLTINICHDFSSNIEVQSIIAKIASWMIHFVLETANSMHVSLHRRLKRIIFFSENNFINKYLIVFVSKLVIASFNNPRLSDISAGNRLKIITF